MALLSSAEFPAIRAAIDVSLNAAMLPDDIIALPIYAGGAEAEVLKRDPDALTRTGLERQRVVNAAIYFTAAKLVRALPQITQMDTDGATYRRKEIDVDKLIADLLQRAEAELAEVLTPEEATPSRPTMFAVASGRRGA